MFDALEQKWKQTEQVGEKKQFSQTINNNNNNNKICIQAQAPPRMGTKGLLWKK